MLFLLDISRCESTVVVVSAAVVLVVFAEVLGGDVCIQIGGLVDVVLADKLLLLFVDVFTHK